MAQAISITASSWVLAPGLTGATDTAGAAIVSQAVEAVVIWVAVVAVVMLAAAAVMPVVVEAAMLRVVVMPKVEAAMLAEAEDMQRAVVDIVVAADTVAVDTARPHTSQN
jgi:hypothetical protein